MRTPIIAACFFAQLVIGRIIPQDLTPSDPAVARRQSSCEHTATSRDCWGDYNIDTDYYEVIPETGVTREYWLSVTNTTLAPDGYSRPLLVFNGTYPGPLIEADWGDNVIIHVTNNLENNGTAIHWHGIRQLNTNEMDGVPGVTQCPIAPGETMTYKWRATQYGSSWYHSHFSSQMAEGMQGPIIIHGPATADYDVDLGALFITDWAHQSSFDIWITSAHYGGQPVLENGLINGSNTYDCSGSNDPACLGTGKRYELPEKFVPGTKYRIRVISSQVDGWMKFTIDGHDFQVIANDFVPIVPYTTNNVLITSGQRYDIIVEAKEDVGNYWMRAIYQTWCNGVNNDNKDNILGIVRYEGSDETAEPTTTKASNINDWCGDEDYDKLVPHLALDAGNAVSEKNLNIQWYFQLDRVYHWTVNTVPLQLDWAEPTNKIIYNNGSVFPTPYNVEDIPYVNEWTVWVIQDFTLVDAFHPMHLHGHDFFILAQGRGIFNHLTETVNLKNPPRRDTATLLGNGYLVIAFKSDNPGSWLMHCHIAWHAGQGLSMQFVERESEIAGTMVHYDDFNQTCAKWEEYEEVAVYEMDDSGI